MPSIDIHLAIARQYLTKHKDIKNTEDFIEGNVAPDLVEDKFKSHYSGKVENKNDLMEDVRKKVRMQEFFKYNNIITDYEKGVFFHLVVDYLFFNNFFEREYLIKNTDENFRKDLYYSYNRTNEYLKTKYDTSYGQLKEKIEKYIGISKSEADYNGENRKDIIPYDKLDKFISKVSDRDIQYFINYRWA